jgi:hypothetical protein
MDYNKKFAPEIEPNLPETRLEELKELFIGVDFLLGSEIIKKMGLANSKYYKDYDPVHNTKIVNDFFKYFCDKGILIVNSGYDKKSNLWIQNFYKFNKEFL